MNQTRNWLSALSRKTACAGLALVMGLFAFLPGIADARLIFTTEGDGTLIDQDLDGDSNFSLFFGASLGEEIEFDTANDRFNITNDIQVTGDVTSTGGVNVQGAAGVTLQNGETITNAVDGNISINANADVTGALDVQGGDITLQSDDTITNTAAGTIGINATNTNLSGSLDVQGGDITLQNDETISNSTDGTVTITADTTETSADLSVGANATVVGTSDLQGNVSNSTGDLTVDDNLSVTGTSSLDGNVTLNNDSQIINLRAENAATLAGTECTGADATQFGRIYYDTTNNELFYCSSAGWTSTDGGAQTVAQTFIPEFGSFAVLADGTDNVGTLTAEFDDTANHGFYRWGTRQLALNDYDLVVQWEVPSNFDSFQANAVTLTYKTTTTTLGDNQIDVVGEDTAGAAITLASNTDLVSTVADTFEDVNMGITGGDFTAGQIVNFKFKVQSTSTGAAFIGPVRINYNTN